MFPLGPSTGAATTVAHVVLLIMLFSMKISQDIRRQHGSSKGEIEEGMAQKSKEFAAAGNRVYLPIAD
ncbi:thiamine biosynthesis protein ThiC [Streptomyces sp. SID7813]|nr:thiamine biosynthesis protein ThiC [Streptomyces sp. SID7813]NSL78720.1 thiamine biosynthesis protein ThiC [Streptomyces coelicolor]QFI47863.1 thiamine biosynthesis protein ThiC [Streptomyces coelicolor A3(2)]QKN71300.1 thiamine biosynthesis protein ThiC [Streptomyces coelicolor]THA94692.1 thiamine biosynthesis protein ThiC [Streptomyces sp. LRa12]